MANIDFSERLSELMLLNNLNVVSLAKKSGCSKTGISFWVKYNVFPTIKNLIKLADFFSCSADYFLGLSDDSSISNYKKDFCFTERLDSLIKSMNISYYRLAKDLDIDERYFTRWKQGIIPKTDVFISIAKYFGCSVDYLVGREV